MTTEAGQALGASAEAPSTVPEQPAEKPADQAGGERAVNQDPQADETKLNALQRFAKQSQERKAAKLAGAQAEKSEKQDSPEKPAAKAEKPADDKVDAKPKADAKDASEAPERDANGRFVGKDKPDAKPDDKAAAGAKEPAKPKPDDGKDEPPPAAAKAPEAKTEPAKEPTKHEHYERRIAELLREKKNWDAERLRHKQETERGSGETKAKLERLARLEKLLERARSDELDDDVLEPLIGRGFVKLVQDINAGKEKGGIAYKARAPVPPELQPLAKELQEQLAEVRAWKQGEEQRKREAEAARLRAEHEAKRKEADAADAERCKTWLADKSEKYPYLTALPDAATQFRDTLYASMRDEKGELTGPEPDPDDIAEQIEQHLSDKLGTVLANEYALKRALRDPKTRELVSRLLAAEAANQTQETNSPQRENKGNQETAGAGKGPPTLSSKVTQEAPVAAEAPDEYEDPEGYRKWLHQQWRNANRKREANLKARFDRPQQ